MGSIAVVGAGNVGLAIGGHMSLNGHDVRIYDRWGEPLKAVGMNGGIDLVGEVEGKGSPATLTSSMQEAVVGAEVIVIAAPAFSHEFIGEHIATLASPEQIVLFQPGVLGSGVNLLKQFTEAGREACFIAEASTSLYTCRKRSDTTVYIGAIKNSVRIAAVPQKHAGHCAEVLNEYFGGGYTVGDDALTVGLDNSNPIYHVPPSILNFKTVEDACGYPLHSLVTPRIAEAIDLIDRERLALASALGVNSMSFWEFLASAYGVTDGDFQSRITQGYGRQAFPEPDSPSHRYFTEDIPYGMVTWLSLGHEVGLDLPGVRSFTVLGSTLCDQDFWETGRTSASLGLQGAGRAGIRAAFIDGELP